MTTPTEYRQMANSISTHWTGGPILTIQGAMKCAAMLREAAERAEQDTRTVAEILQAVQDARLKWYRRDAVRDATHHILARLGLEEETPGDSGTPYRAPTPQRRIWRTRASPSRGCLAQPDAPLFGSTVSTMPT